MFIEQKVQASRIARGHLVRDVAILAGGGIVAQAIPILLTPVLTRLYTPEAFGTLGLYTAFISIVTHTVTLGYSHAVVSASDDHEAATLVLLAAILASPMSILGGVFLYQLISNDLLGYGGLPVWTALAMAASLLFTGLYFTLRYWLIRQRRYKEISAATVAQSVGRMLVQTAGGLSSIGVIGLVAGEVVGRAAGLKGMWATSMESLPESGITAHMANLASVARKYKDFPLLSAPSSLLNSFALALPVPLVTAYFGIAAAGQFSVATRVMVLPLALIGMSVGDVFHTRIAEMSISRPDRALGFLLKSIAALLCMGLIPGLVVIFWGSTLFALVLGAEWATAGRIASAIVPWVVMQVGISPVSKVVHVYRSHEIKLVYDVLAIASVFGAFTYGHANHWSLIDTCALAGLSQAGIYVMYLALLVAIVIKKKDINARV